MQRRMKWIAISLGLHALCVWLVWRANDTVKPQSRRPLELTLRTPAPKPPAPAPIVIAKTRSSPVRAPALPPSDTPAPAAPVPPASEAPRATGPSTPSPDSPRATVVKLSDGALVGIAGVAPKQRDPRAPGSIADFGDDGLDEKTRVEARLKAGVEGFMVAQDTKTGARGTVASLRRAIRERFEPVSAYVQKIPGSAKASAQVAKNRLEVNLRPRSTAVMEQGLVPSQQALQQGMSFGDPCAQSHEIGRLEARFRVEHDQKGQAQEWSLQLSSGDDAFDGYARDVLRQATTIALKAHPDEAIPLYSEWLLSQIVYDWNSSIFCPATDRPPGLPVFADKPGVTYTAEVSLLAVRYRR